MEAQRKAEMNREYSKPEITEVREAVSVIKMERTINLMLFCIQIIINKKKLLQQAASVSISAVITLLCAQYTRN